MMTSLSPKQEKLLTFFLSAILFTHSLDFVIIMPLGPQFMRVFAIDPATFSLTVSAYTFSAGISGLLSSLVVDRYDRKTALIFLYAGFCVSTLLCAMAPTHTFFLIARSMAGLFGGILSAMVFSIIGDVIPEERRGLTTGRVMSAFSLASIAGVPFGLKIAQIWNWRAPFFLLTILSLPLLIIGWRALPKMTSHIHRSPVAKGRIRQTLDLLTKANHIRAYLLSGMLMFAAFSVIPFISPSVVANAGFSEDDLKYIYLVGGAFTFFTSPVIGRFSDRFGKLRVFQLMALFSVIPFLLVTHLEPSSFWIVIGSTTLFMICTSGRMVPATALITSSSIPEERGGFMSVNSSVQQFSAALSTFLAGQIVVKSETGRLLHYEIVGYIAVVTTLICLWLATRIRPAIHEEINRKFSQDSG